MNGEPKPYVDWDKMLINKVKRQAETAVALGVRLEVHCLQPEVANILRREVKRLGPLVRVFPVGDP